MEEKTPNTVEENDTRRFERSQSPSPEPTPKKPNPNPIPTSIILLSDPQQTTATQENIEGMEEDGEAKNDEIEEEKEEVDVDETAESPSAPSFTIVSAPASRQDLKESAVINSCGLITEGDALNHQSGPDCPLHQGDSSNSKSAANPAPPADPEPTRNAETEPLATLGESSKRDDEQKEMSVTEHKKNSYLTKVIKSPRKRAWKGPPNIEIWEDEDEEDREVPRRRLAVG
jgi:hypothetical protein